MDHNAATVAALRKQNDLYYRCSPVGLPMPPEFERNKEFAIPALNRLLQELAWDTVIHSPLAGVTPEASRPN